MEQRLPQPIEAEVVDARGRWMCVKLVEYLGEDRWRAIRPDGDHVLVKAENILDISCAVSSDR